MSTEQPSPRSPGQNRPDQDQPLDLTVHALPGLEQSVPVNTRGRLKMLFILLVCAAPVLASYFMYYVVRPEGRRNYGELITPQRPLPSFNVTTLGGAALPVGGLKDQWLLISVAGAACDALCQQHLYFQRQLRESLGRKKTGSTGSGWSLTTRRFRRHWRQRSRTPPCCASAPPTWRNG